MSRPRITMRGDNPYEEEDLWTFLRMHAEANADNQPTAPPPQGDGKSPCMKHGWKTQSTHPPGASTKSGPPKPVRAKLWTTHHTHKATDPAKAWPDH